MLNTKYRIHNVKAIPYKNHYFNLNPAKTTTIRNIKECGNPKFIFLSESGCRDLHQFCPLYVSFSSWYCEYDWFYGKVYGCLKSCNKSRTSFAQSINRA